ncbi:hypothetical protein GGI13_004877, partial [Coemansia sp. RSA 455]
MRLTLNVSLLFLALAVATVAVPADQQVGLVKRGGYEASSVEPSSEVVYKATSEPSSEEPSSEEPPVYGSSEPSSEEPSSEEPPVYKATSEPSSEEPSSEEPP